MSTYADRIERVAARARAERADFDPPASPPAAERAIEYVREGLGPTVSIYVEARTGAEQARLSSTDLDRLQTALNDWLAVYARCYGVEMDPAFTIREAAELLVETRDARDTAALLTHLPDADGER